MKRVLLLSMLLFIVPSFLLCGIIKQNEKPTNEDISSLRVPGITISSPSRPWWRSQSYLPVSL